MPAKATASGSKGYTGEVSHARRFDCCVTRLNGEEWRQAFCLMSAANQDQFTLGIVGKAVVRRMKLPADREIQINDSMHSFATLSPSLRENQNAWYFIEVMKTSVAGGEAEPK